ncbi:UDP-N-acetylmuramate: L-alanyl-gamma-D-glutamyl-meso-diaminopimelate ligase [Methylomarinovum caldicuralii]|uniref:UDP-N-acetylmuramate--L-alanyl-gamma-D-glutamyl-meso-2,6-diaminoheptandioate ligase n=1 Tax=Methylomarinovum caldicuralii TaxID=438856 RepID=A0AAU9CSW9_9GAMM|nr:UDP-N-acetylmuramate:L-alanyl-gamma-D-glutamyl-meso-diaminopimelate ligase [Methylomarinovum caldicuralii]BCX81007.1 UDP-N-acetylmuramate: L-alanyl-gamma-D-glutamyl-meso-diaminopimelate ligase [Methylomarinovum caldicuralii]
MHIHILGICGTFMGGLALLARELGLSVSGSDQNVYPPMSTQLEEAGIRLSPYDPANLHPRPDQVIVGNALSRGNPEVEAVLNQCLPYTSGPQWLAETILQSRRVIGIAGTHGKTTTTAMVAWILEAAGLAPGFLIGGVPKNFGRSARLGSGEWFVIEADEYDTAFFDKRSKFVHYRPWIAVLNNLEYDHADIFPDLAAIQTQFHHLVRTVPGQGRLLVASGDKNLEAVLARGCWSPVERFGIQAGDWQAQLQREDGSRFRVSRRGEALGEVAWELSGRHNVANALGAIAAAAHAGVPASDAIEALGSFAGVKRRLELRGEAAGVRIYDDFAHHPTAIAATLEGLRARIGNDRLVAILEPRSNTMRMGVHNEQLGPSLAAADVVYLHTPPDLGWDPRPLTRTHPNLQCFENLEALLNHLLAERRPGDHWIFMSNSGFGNIHQRALERLQEMFHVEHP